MTDKKLLEMMKRIKIIYPYTFKDFDEKDVVIKRAMSKAKQPPVPADVIEEIEKLRRVNGKSDAQLWDEALRLMETAQDCAGRFNYTALDPNGKTQGENARAELREEYGKVNAAVKEYFGSLGNLLSIARDMSDETVSYERGRFFKHIGICRNRVDDKKEVNSLLLQGVKTLLLREI